MDPQVAARNAIIRFIAKNSQKQATRASIIAAGFSERQVTFALESPFLETVSKGKKSDRDSRLYGLTFLGKKAAGLRG